MNACAVPLEWTSKQVSRVKKNYVADMEVAALVALTLLLGALVILVALAVGRRKEEKHAETEQQAADSSGKRAVCSFTRCGG